MNSVYNLVSKIIYSEPNPGGRVAEIKSSAKTLPLRGDLLQVKYILLFIHANLLFRNCGNSLFTILLVVFRLFRCTRNG